ncbi:hypothetical protein DFH27DRAFT_245051 [Peziza echinospora]|nr:hypothetical protein DFH27DRAFT_245051 [Peziza echinospora]
MTMASIPTAASTSSEVKSIMTPGNPTRTGNPDETRSKETRAPPTTAKKAESGHGMAPTSTRRPATASHSNARPRYSSAPPPTVKYTKSGGPRGHGTSSGNSKGNIRASSAAPALAGAAESSTSKKKSPRDFTKPPTLPPLDLGASIGGVGLDKTVRRMELQLRGLEIQFERFKRAHEELKNDYEDLETYCEELEEAFLVGEKGSGSRDAGGKGETEQGGKENVKGEGGQEKQRSRSSPTRPSRPAYRRVRSAPRTRARSSTASSSTSGPPKRRASSHQARGAWGQITPTHQRSQSGPGLRSSSIRRSRSRANSAGDGDNDCAQVRQSSHSVSSSQRQMKPRVLPKRMRSVAIPARDLETIQYSELGSTYAAFPERSKLVDLWELDTFKIAQGPSTVRRWKNGKPPA